MFIEGYDLKHGTYHMINTNMITIITEDNESISSCIVAMVNNHPYKISEKDYLKLCKEE